jgi:transcriptional regulator with XRE-family HTH domain
MMDAARIIRDARSEAGLTLRELARRAGTSHSTLAAYEHGRTDPTVATLDRVLRACGYAADVQLRRRVRRDEITGLDRGRELAEVVGLAEMFPARHAEKIEMPVFTHVARSVNVG